MKIKMYDVKCNLSFKYKIQSDFNQYINIIFKILFHFIEKWFIQLVTSISLSLSFSLFRSNEIFYPLAWEQKKKNVSLLVNKREFRSKISVVYKFVIESFVRFIGTIGIRKQCMSCFASRSCFRSWRGCRFCLVSFFFLFFLLAILHSAE